jgi:hypothetical protein
VRKTRRQNNNIRRDHVLGYITNIPDLTRGLMNDMQIPFDIHCVYSYLCYSTSTVFTDTYSPSTFIHYIDPILLFYIDGTVLWYSILIPFWYIYSVVRWDDTLSTVWYIHYRPYYGNGDTHLFKWCIAVFLFWFMIYALLVIDDTIRWSGYIDEMAKVIQYNTVPGLLQCSYSANMKESDACMANTRPANGYRATNAIQWKKIWPVLQPSIVRFYFRE